MANASNRFQTYIWLLDTINRSGGISLERINALWQRTEMSEGRPLPRQTFVRHVAAIEDMFDIIIECDRRTNTYHISDAARELRHGSMKRWLLSTMTMAAVLQESRSIQDRILLEQVPSGDTHLIYISRAMEEGRTIHVTYQKFVDSEPYEAELEPYCLKLFRQRWYLLAHRPGRDYLAMYALDRMVSVEETERPFTLPKDFNAQDVFSEVYGAFRPSEDEQPQFIRLRTYEGEWNYLRTLPLHHSQKEVKSTHEYVDFTYRLYPTKDFKMELLSRYSFVEVLSPESLRQEMREMLECAVKRYRD